MALQTVNVYVEDNQPVPQPVEGVTVRVFMADDATLVTEASTDPTGLASFTLDDVNPTYILRFYKFSTAIPQPQSITMAAPWPLEIDVVAQVFERPTSPDPLMCRVSGYLRDQYGNPGDVRRLRARPVRDPTIIQEDPPNFIVEAGYEVQSTEDGFIQFDLFRGSIHDVRIPGWEDEPILAEVPDSAWIDITDFLLPVPAMIELETEVPPLTIPLEGSLTVIPLAKLSNGIWLADNRMEYTKAPMTVASDDPAIVAVSGGDIVSSGEGVLLQGLSLGVTNVTFSFTNVNRYYATRVPPYLAQDLVVQVFVVV